MKRGSMNDFNERNNHVHCCCIIIIVCVYVLLWSGFSAPLPGFLRRLFLQVLLEEEKILVSVHSSSHARKQHSGELSAGKLQHPHCGAGHRHCTMLVGLQTSCAELIG